MAFGVVERFFSSFEVGQCRLLRSMVDDIDDTFCILDDVTKSKLLVFYFERLIHYEFSFSYLLNLSNL
jgi:hypothetical protein